MVMRAPFRSPAFLGKVQIMTLPSVTDLKAQAKRLRAALAKKGQVVTHSQSLELLSAQYGFRDWNTATAAASAATQLPFSLGDRVSGVYMSQPFEGEIIGLSKLGGSDDLRVCIQFDEAVDVVTFESFSSHRSRVNCVIGGDGIAIKKTSNGEPYLKMKRTE
ncbi:hypothetical protein LP7551_01297 [Roseibium album]|nr:hypothetical protein LP7551_01297 [Roseibium album]